jgi:hypothetical protein
MRQRVMTTHTQGGKQGIESHLGVVSALVEALNEAAGAVEGLHVVQRRQRRLDPRHALRHVLGVP